MSKKIEPNPRDAFLTQTFGYLLNEETVEYFSEPTKTRIISDYWAHLDPECPANDAFQLFSGCQIIILDVLRHHLGAKEFEALLKKNPDLAWYECLPDERYIAVG